MNKKDIRQDLPRVVLEVNGFIEDTFTPFRFVESQAEDGSVSTHCELFGRDEMGEESWSRLDLSGHYGLPEDAVFGLVRKVDSMYRLKDKE